MSAAAPAPNPLATGAKSRSARPLFGRLHRWVGLLIAGFLFVSGLTGAVISWDHELDELLNPHLLESRAVGPARPSLELARAVEARHPAVKVSYVPLSAEPGHSLGFGVDPRVDPKTGELFDVPFNEVFVDPADGTELGRREWGAAWPLARETFVSFLYKLHYTLHLPEMWGTDEWGVWLLGIIAVLWTADCFVGFYLTLPARSGGKPRPDEALALDERVPAAAPEKTFWRRWRPAFQVRFWGGPYRINFDLHRAAGLWTWGLLFIVAFTAFSMNLYREVFLPAMSLVSNVTPSPYDQRTPRDHDDPIEPKLSFEAILPLARAEAARRGWEEPAGDLYYSGEYGIYSVSFFRLGDGHGSGGVGHRQLYLDALDGRLLGASQPWQGTAADIFVQAQFPLHSGRILGLPGRILISLMGLIVAGLSVTGVVIWWHKRRARKRAPRLSLAVVVSFALALAACNDDGAGPSEPAGEGKDPAVMLVGQVYGPDEYLTYVGIYPDVPEGELDFRAFREFGNANAYTYGGYVFVEEEGRVRRFSVDANLELVDGPILSWQNHGIASINASYTVFVSARRAYSFAPELGVVLVWDPETMELTGTLPLEMPERPAGMETWAYDGYLIGDKVVWNVFSGSWDALEPYPAVTLAIADADSDEPVRFVEDSRCLPGGPSLVDERGDYYVQGAGYYGYFWAYGDVDGARTCMLRLNAGESELDPEFLVDYEELAGSYVTDLWLPIGDHRYVVRSWDPGVSFPEDPDEFWDNPALHSLLVDTDAGSAVPYPDLEGAIGVDGVARNVDGVSYYQISDTGYVEGGEADVVELRPDGIRQKFHLNGFLLGLQRIR